MTNYWAIAIGINQYQHFQPLLYAQRDAHAMRGYWVNEAGFAPDQCLLLTDASSAMAQEAMSPTRDTIQHYITRLCQEKAQAGDSIWFFFSGYGVQMGGKDYLMPVDGDPKRVADTGIALEWVFQRLQSAPADNSLLILDMNRSQSALAGARIGAQTLQLAQDYGITTLLSCAPDQFSHETLALRQGLFTAALLEGLRYQGCVTSEHLAHYLSKRLPELSEHHWRPKQTPIAVIPPQKKYQLILPGKAIAGVGAASSAYGASPLQTATEQGSMTGGTDGTAAPGMRQSSLALVPVGSQNWAGAGSGGRGNGTEGASAAGSVPGTEQTLAADAGDDELLWRRLLMWGGIIALILFLLVLLRNYSALFGNPSPDREQLESLVPIPTEETDPVPQPFGETGEPGGTAAGSQSGGVPDDQTGTATVPPPTGEGTDNGGVLTFDPNPSPDPSAQTGAQLPLSAESQSALESARAAIRAQQYERALSWLDRIPTDQRTEEYNQLRQQANQELLTQARLRLNQTRGASRVNQASDFSRAIEQANRIRPGEPLYEQAQQDIQRWSLVILDLAVARASQGNYDSAIAAARLIPSGQAEVYAEAQQAIAQWQQAKANQMILNRAKSLVNPNQASSYNRAIATARGIQPNAPLYAEAQALIDQWSQTILELARSRAAQGRISEAIQTATLVPRDTSAYSQAQEAIANWRSHS